ncbi:LysR family transcriptional regulator [Thalassospiraceae bacterium LMO-JJ14]|nr:LysR family transcriptional regulator [Thalassospiraceae bacterium LMO-JJ14]
MDASDLKVFEAVARLGGMNRAAGELNTVQSNVTQRIKLLEEDLGTVLFDRHSRGVSLTPAGKRLIPYARDIRNTLEDARRAVIDDGTPQGPLHLGALETTAALRLNQHFTDFVAHHPNVDFTLRTGTTAELVAMVLEREVEGAFACGPVDHPDLVSETVFNEELVILSAPGLVQLEDILDKPDVRMIVLRAGCSYRQRMEEVLTRRGVVNPRLLEFGTLEVIISAVAAGLGITMLPKTLIGRIWDDGRVAMHTLPRQEAAVETLYVQRKDTRASSAAIAFRDMVQHGRSAVAAE